MFYAYIACFFAFCSHSLFADIKKTPAAAFLQWLFGNKPATGINGIEDNANTTVTGIYNASGMKLQKMQRGLNIVRTADGKTVKIMK